MEELFKLIEDYLNDALPEEQRLEVERRMASDEDFQREVALHRAMQEEFGDARGWSVYATMSEIMEEEALPDDAQPDGISGSPSEGFRKWWWVVPVVLVAVAGIWYFSRLAERNVPEQPVQEPPVKSSPNATQPIATENDSQPENKPEDRRIIAKADPTDFIPNPTMEIYIESKTLGPEDISVQITIPQNTTAFYLNKKGQTRLRFVGAFSALPSNEKTAFDLLLFDNKNDGKPLMTIPLNVSADAAGSADFDLGKTVEFRQGLYYFQIEEKESGGVLMTGKFLIGKL